MKIYNAHIYTMNSKDEIIENGWAEIRDGKIINTGSGTCSTSSDDIDAGGQILMPGFIDAHTHLGIIGNGVAFESDDCNEQSDPVTPHVRAVDGINPFDFCFEEAHNRGITSVLTCPGSANAVGGEIVAIKTTGHCIDKMIIKECGIKFALGENPKTVYNDRDETPVTRMATAALIREILMKAKRYHEDICRYKADPENNQMPEFDMKLESLIPLLKHEKKAHFHCHRADDICTAVRISKEFNLDYVLIHATDGYLVSDILGEDHAYTVVGPIICDRAKPELKSMDIKNAACLHKDGANIAICTDHPVCPIQYLPISAAIAVKGGLNYMDALHAITSGAAHAAGISDITGSIEPGKDADIQLYDSDPLDVMSEPTLVMINGKIIS
ncbi:MAG: amidohydrolase [Oscillospiraceae bacterium]|nr:amidohydrolase [Oscillospiraceae bacterium]